MPINFFEHEITLRRVLRLYRTFVLGFIRLRLIARFGSSAPDQLAALFAKSFGDKTQWDQMKEDALAARAPPEISTVVSDAFELLSVTHFYPVFEKFYDVLFPESAGWAETVKKEARSGILRCIRQIKVFRDPNSHEVTEDLNSDSLLLFISNAIAVMKACGAGTEVVTLREIMEKIVTEKATYSAAVLSCSVSDGVGAAIVRSLEAKGVTVRGIVLSEECDEKIVNREIESEANLVFILNSESLASAPFKSAAKYASSLGKELTILSLLDVAEGDITSFLSTHRIRSRGSVQYHPSYLGEVSERLLQRMVRTPKPILRYPPVSVATARSVLDEQLRIRICSELTTNLFHKIWFVSPFANDLVAEPVRSQLLTALLGEQRRRGVEITLITRPPSPSEGVAAKRRFLDTLERDEIKILINERLHAKIYLFEGEAAQYRWFLGSHNLTTTGLSRWRDASMEGAREVEYREAEQAMIGIREDRNTVPYYMWKAKQSRQIEVAP